MKFWQCTVGNIYKKSLKILKLKKLKGMYAFCYMGQLKSRIFMLTDIEMLFGDKIDLHGCFKFSKKKFRNTVHSYEIL